MESTFPSLWKKTITYLQENIGGSIAFFFLLVAGIAAGMNMIQSLYRNMALHVLGNVFAMLEISGIPWLRMVLLSVSVHTAFCSMLLLSGLWLPAGIFWPAAVLLRGLVMGAGLGACVLALPSYTAWIILTLLWIEAAFLLPPMLRMSICAGRQILSRATMHQNNLEEHSYIKNMLRCALWLLPCILIECLAMPLLVYMFG